MTNITDHLTALDYGIVVTYLIILIVIGYQASFSRKAKTGETLFLANKSLNWPSIGFNMWGTNVGPSMLLSFYIFAVLLVVAIVISLVDKSPSTASAFSSHQPGSTSTRVRLAWAMLIAAMAGLYAVFR